MQRGDLLLFGIEVLGAGAYTTASLIDAIVGGYAAYYHPRRGRGGEKVPRNLADAVERIVDELHEDVRGQQRIRKLLNNLKTQGLAVKVSTTGSWYLTARGIARRAKLRRNFQYAIPRYRGTRTTRMIIVAFDVPEREHKKRDWLRCALEVMGLEPLQKSVWVGKIRLPPEFFEDLEALGLTACVQVLGVTESGTLRTIY